jgi:hypothetical protein
MSRDLFVRACLFLLLLAYLGLIAISHAQPLNSGLEAPLAFGGWLALVGIAVVAWLRQRRIGLRRGKLEVRQLFQPAALTVLFGLVAAIALLSSFSGNLSIACPSTARSCVKIDQWKVSDGHYYRLFPYNSAGDSDPNQPWVEIDRQTYVDEVGTRLRMAAAFGVGALCFAWLITAALRSRATESTS